MPSPALLPWAGKTYDPPLPTDIATLEAAILAKLKGVLPTTVAVDHYPDKPESYRLVSQLGAVLVLYVGDKYGEMLASDVVVQPRDIEFDIAIVSRSLGWAYASGDPSGLGAYQLIEQVREILTGFQIPGCTKMFPKRARFIKRDEQGGVFYYAFTFGFRTWASEDSTTDDLPTLSKVQFFENAGETTEAVAPASYTFSSGGTIQLPDQNISNVLVQSGSTTYVLGTDYTVDPANGIITWLSTGAIPAEATVTVSYDRADVATAIAGGGSAPTAPTN